MNELLGASDYLEAEHGEILRLYRAIFNREADIGGAKYWIVDVYSTGVSVEDITSLIANDDQPEFRSAYDGVHTDGAFVDRLYQNMLGRPPDPQGKEYWTDLMADGLTRSATARWVALSPEFIRLYPYKAAPASSRNFKFTAGGDHGARADTEANFSAIADANPAFHLALGDLSYSETDTESQWCDLVKSHLGDTPVQLVVGNHEDDFNVDGYIGNFAQCLPDRMGSTGTYGAEYYFDVNGLARIIMIGADNRVDGEFYDYDKGSKHYNWLASVIDDARANGIKWIIVGMHKVCLSAGAKSCEVGIDVIDLLVEKKVDLIFHGHEHNYQRSKQVACVEMLRYESRCVVDDGADNHYGAGQGTVWVVSGLMGGGNYYTIDVRDPEYRYLAESMGDGHPQASRGFSQIEVTEQQLLVEFVATTSDYEDRFVIS